MTELTPRERQVLQLAAGGATNAQIAQALGISTKTVHHHIHNLSEKYGTSGRVQAIVHGFARGDIHLLTAQIEVEARRMLQ